MWSLFFLWGLLLANISVSSWGIRAGALVLSFALWLHAVTEKYYDKEVAVRLWIEVPPPGEGVDGDMVLASEVPSTVRVLVTGGGKDLLFDLDDDSFVLKLRAEGKNRIHRLTPSQITKRAGRLGCRSQGNSRTKRNCNCPSAEDGTGCARTGASESRSGCCPCTGDADASRSRARPGERPAAAGRSIAVMWIRIRWFCRMSGKMWM